MMRLIEQLNSQYIIKIMSEGKIPIQNLQTILETFCISASSEKLAACTIFTVRSEELKKENFEKAFLLNARIYLFSRTILNNLIKLTIVLLIMALITSCQTNKSMTLKTKQDNKMELKKNKEIVIRFNKEFFESGNTEITKELLSDTFVNHTAPQNAPTDASVMIQFITGFHKNFSHISVQINEVLAEDNKVSVRKTITATHSGEFMGKKATGKTIQLNVIEIDILKEGKITDHWSKNDFMQVIQEL